MSQTPPPPRRRNAPVVVYPGSPPAKEAAREAGPRGRDDRPRLGPTGRPADDRRRRMILIGVGVAALVIVIAAVAVLAGGGGGGGKSGPKFKASTAVDLKVGETRIEGTAYRPYELTAAARDSVLSTLGTYVDNAIVVPLRKGKADDKALLAAFDPGAGARLAGLDRGILVDEGLPKAVGKIKVTTPPVPLVALGDNDGNITLISGGVDFQVTARVEQGTVTIKRTGSFVFAPDQGAWKISGWTLAVTRTGPGVTPPSTAAAPTPTTAAR